MAAAIHGGRSTKQRSIRCHTGTRPRDGIGGNAKSICWAMALDWAKFFDSINRDIGDALMRKLMTQDSSVEANNHISAESRFGRQARYRFKIGKATTAVSKTRGGGYFQGPSYSIQVALACMSVWTRLLETETRCKTCGFIDDSSLKTDSSLEEDEALTQLQEAWDKSKDFGILQVTSSTKPR